MISAKVIAHTINTDTKDELISMELTFPRILLPEFNTHRMLSKSTSSSRAIPFKKMVEEVKNNPFIPVAFQKSHSGMQGSEYVDSNVAAKSYWLDAALSAIEHAESMHRYGISKQICNRLLEPFMWVRMVATGMRKEAWDNLLRLRSFNPTASKPAKNLNHLIDEPYYSELAFNEGGAEIHFSILARCINVAINNSKPEVSDHHIPYLDRLVKLDSYYSTESYMKASVALCARASYTKVGEESDYTIDKLIELHDRLADQHPPHSSPFEHVAIKAEAVDYHNLRGFKSLRYERGI